MRVTRHSRRVRDVPDLKLSRRDLEIKGWAYGPGGSDTFVLEPPEAYQHHYYKTPPARGQRLTRTDHLVTLDLTDPVTDAQIKARYRSLARQHHPDVNPGDAEADEMFKRVVAAYEALIPPGTRVVEEEVERAEAGSSPASARGAVPLRPWRRKARPRRLKRDPSACRPPSFRKWRIICVRKDWTRTSSWHGR